MTCNEHSGHGHSHESGCGHQAVRHGDHVDYLHDGHLHSVHGTHVDEHALAVAAANPDGCTPTHSCGGHEQAHRHASSCGHSQIPHGDHVDYLVGDHLHHPHAGHCDDHGTVSIA